MRLDKFLKVSRIVKRRPVANELCSTGTVQINGKVAKASSTVKVGDVIQLQFGNREIIARILEVPEKTPPAHLANSLYQTLSN